MHRRRLPIFSSWIEGDSFFFSSRRRKRREGADRVSFRRDRSKLARVDLFISGTYLPAQARDTPRLESALQISD